MERARSLAASAASAHHGSPRWSGSVKSAPAAKHERASHNPITGKSALLGCERAWVAEVIREREERARCFLAAKHERVFLYNRKERARARGRRGDPGAWRARSLRSTSAPHGWLLTWGCEDTKGKLCAWMAQKRTEQRAKLMTCIFAKHGMLARSGKSPGFWRWCFTARIYVFHGSVSLLQWRKKMIKRKTLLNKKKQQKNLGWS